MKPIRVIENPVLFFKINEYFFFACGCLITVGFVSGSSEMFIINKRMPSVDKNRNTDTWPFILPR
jgi:hypothetical protein